MPRGLVIPSRSIQPLPERRTSRHAAAAGANDRIDRWMAAAALFSAAAIGLFGALAAALFIMLALAMVARQPGARFRELVHYSPLLFIPILGMLSTLWSDAPQQTLRASIQTLLTMGAAITVYRRVEPHFLLLVLFGAFLALCLAALPFIPDAVIKGYPLGGMYANKNQLGATVHLAMALSLAVCLDGTQAKIVRIVALCALPFSAVLLFLTESATALSGAGITIILFPLLLLFGRTPISARVALFVTAAALVAVALFFLPDISNAIADFRQNVLKKNATLTGRTYLWEVAARLTAERPLLGHGFSAFWRQGNLDAEGLYRWGGIASRSGFNFHNAFVEMKIDLGLIGQGLLFATCGAFAAVGLFRHLVKPSTPLAFFLALQTVLYIRSYTETGLIAPFGLVTMLWVMAGMCALSSGVRDKPAEEPSAPPRKQRIQLPRDPVRA